MVNQSSIEAVQGDNNQWISMSNALTRSAHGLSLAEKRIVALALTQVDSKKSIASFDVTRKYKILAVDFAETFSLDPDTAYTQLKAAGKRLRGRYISFHDPAWIRKGKPLKTTHMNWMGSVTYHDGQGWIDVSFNHELLPHIVGLQKNFTQYQLAQVSALRSKYSWDLLKLLMRFESTGWAEYTVEDFAASMEATEKQLQNFNNIKRRMIEPAIKELTEKDGWIIAVKYIKASRKVIAIRFDFKRNPQQQLPL